MVEVMLSYYKNANDLNKLAVLHYMMHKNCPLTVKEISKQLNLSYSLTYKILQELVSEKFVEVIKTYPRFYIIYKE